MRNFLGAGASTEYHILKNFNSPKQELPMKKSRRELAREIIANLRRGMNRPPLDASQRKDLPEPTPFMPMPLIRPTLIRSRRSGQLQTSHS